MKRWLLISLFILCVSPDQAAFRKASGIYGGITATQPPQPQAPVNSAPPTISGNATVGSALNIIAGTWSDSPTLTYSWRYATDPVNSGSSTGNTYNIVAADTGQQMVVDETATSSFGATTASSAPTATITQPVTGAPIPVTGSGPVATGPEDSLFPRQGRYGQTLSVTDGAWTNCGTGNTSCTLTYQWFSNHDAILGATNNSYTVPSTNLITYYATVTATNALGSGVAVSSQVFVWSRPPATDPGGSPPAQVSVTVNGGGYPVVGSVLTINNGPAWTPGPTGYSTYKWYGTSSSTGGNNKTIYKPNTSTAESGSTHTVWSDDVGYNISIGGPNSNTWQSKPPTVGPIATNTSSKPPIPLTFTAPPTLGGINIATAAYVGYPLATGNTYWSSNGATASKMGTFSSFVGGYYVSDIDGYQWYVCTANPCQTPTSNSTGSPIAGATNPYFMPGTDLLGKQVYAMVQATNSTGTAQGFTAPSPIITNPPIPSANATPLITGPAIYGNVGGQSTGGRLVLSGSSWNSPAPIVTSYQWYQGTPGGTHTPATGPGATTSSYWPVAADVGKTLYAQVFGYNISGVGAATSAVTPVVVSYSAPAALGSGALGVYPSGFDPLNSAGCIAPPSSFAHSWYVNNSTGTAPTATYGGGAYNGGSAGAADGTSAHPFNSLKAMTYGGESGGTAGYARPLMSTVRYNHTGMSSSDAAAPAWAASNPGVGVHGLQWDTDWNPPGSPPPGDCSSAGLGGTKQCVAPGHIPCAAFPGTDPTGASCPAFSVNTNRINPGDKVVLQTGSGSYGTLSLNGVNTNLTNGQTNWMTIQADTSATPVIDGVATTSMFPSGSPLSGINTQGWNMDGLTVQSGQVLLSKGAATNIASPSIGTLKDIIFTNGTVQTYSSLSALLSDYNATCPNGVAGCQYTSINNFLNKLTGPAFVVAGSVPSGSDAQCFAITKNTVRWTASAISVFWASDILVEQNDFGYNSWDTIDFGTGTTIFHLNYLHDALYISGSIHTDGIQSQNRNNGPPYSFYGFVWDSNRNMGQMDNALASVSDWQSGGGTANLVEAPSCMIISGNYYSANMYTNSVCQSVGAFNISNFTLTTWANNNWVGGNGAGAINVLENYGTDAGDYWANNTATTFSLDCTNNTWTNNAAVPMVIGSSQTGPSASSSGGSCSPTTSMVTIGPVPQNAFTHYLPNSNGFNTTTTIDLHPTTGGLLKGQGIAGGSVPTVTGIIGSTPPFPLPSQTTRPSPPSIGTSE